MSHYVGRDGATYDIDGASAILVMTADETDVVWGSWNLSALERAQVAEIGAES